MLLESATAIHAAPDEKALGEMILDAAVRRVPALGSAGIALFFNGPESFTPDLRPIVGEAPELKAYAGN